MTAMMPATGQTLNGRYQIIRELAQGGFGATFLAEDLHLPEHPLCVVKQLKPPTAEPSTLTIARRLFETEAHILHEIGKHDQIPQLFAYFEEQQEFYLVEAYIEGQSLREELNQKGKLSPDEVVTLLKEILDILIFVHGNQVIHRDLNPSNMIRRKSDHKMCLIDFGAVKRVTTQFATASGGATVAIGTQGYLPSEQAQGRPQFGSDIYAVGMIGIEALTGLAPHNFKVDPRTAEILWQDLVQVDDGLAQVLNKMVRHDFRERFFTAQEARQALEDLDKVTFATVVLGQPRSPTMQPTMQPMSTMSTQTPLMTPTQSSSPRDLSTKAVLVGLGLAALVTVGVSINLGMNWWANRQVVVQEYKQGQLFQEMNQPEKAIASYRQVLKTNPEHQGALLGLAQSLQQLKRYDDALKAYDQVLKINPNSWEAWWGQGKILSDRKQYDKSLIALDKALQGNSRSAEIWQTKAQIHLARKETDQALSSLESLLELDNKQAWAWYEKGWIHQGREEYAQAIAAYDRAIRIDNSDPNIWYQRGNSLFKLQKYGDAKDSYQKVVNLKPDHAPAWYSLGIAAENLQKYADAQDAFAKVVELEPKNDRAWYHLAWNAQQNSDRPTAINAYNETLTLKADDRTSWHNLSELLYAAENYTDAIPAYEHALALDPKDGDSWAHLGDSYKATKQYQQAIAAYDQALTYKANDPQILANRKEADDLLQWEQAQQGLQQQAEDIKNKAKDIKGKADDIKKEIKRVVPWL